MENKNNPKLSQEAELKSLLINPDQNEKILFQSLPNLIDALLEHKFPNTKKENPDSNYTSEKSRLNNLFSSWFNLKIDRKISTEVIITLKEVLAKRSGNNASFEERVDEFVKKFEKYSGRYDIDTYGISKHIYDITSKIINSENHICVSTKPFEIDSANNLDLQYLVKRRVQSLLDLLFSDEICNKSYDFILPLDTYSNLGIELWHAFHKLIRDEIKSNQSVRNEKKNEHFQIRLQKFVSKEQGLIDNRKSILNEPFGITDEDILADVILNCIADLQYLRIWVSDEPIFFMPHSIINYHSKIEGFISLGEPNKSYLNIHVMTENELSEWRKHNGKCTIEAIENEHIEFQENETVSDFEETRKLMPVEYSSYLDFLKKNFDVRHKRVSLLEKTRRTYKEELARY